MHRKVVTVLFCDVVGSTALGEAIDPEALQGLLARYFERMREIVERHGGTVEKFIGDAVMAVFGVPVIHEDDALRACNAAFEMRQAFPELGVQGRIGIETGEVVTGTEERLATGDPVNVAARLQQAAAPGEILVGEETLELAGNMVEVAAVEALELKGKSAVVAAYRLLAVRGARERAHASAFVGREAEVQLIRGVWQKARAERRCELLTVVGDAGIGKSRLVAEALGPLDARIVRGRCLPYGEGITYRPVTEVVQQLGALPADPAAAAAIRSLLRESDEVATAEETAWAFRKLLEEQAPLVVVFDDLQWGEETFLELVEAVALLSTAAPLLLLCVTRPELVERRPQWPSTLRLEPLADKDVDELLGDTISGGLRKRITRAASGNPLFLTEMLAMAEGDAEVDVPPTLRALLAARLDQLDPPERAVLERGAVEGEVFHRGGVQALSPEDPHVTPRLASLVRRGLIRPDRSQLPRDDGFRFRHLLIRDTAYDALPKAARADLHEHFADWLEANGLGLVELDEILGFHLEQAARYSQELGVADAALAERAAGHLAAAGRRALERADERAAAPLLERALELTRPLRLDVALEADLASAMFWSDNERAAAIGEAAAVRAREAGDRTGEALARVIAAYHGTFTGEVSLETLERVARSTLPRLDRAGDQAGLVFVWTALGNVANSRGQWGEFARCAEEALRHARLCGQRSVASPFHLGLALLFGPTPADDALRRLDALFPGSNDPRYTLVRARLLAALGRFDEAWSLAAPAAERLGLDGEWHLGEISWLAGDHERATAHLRQFCSYLEATGKNSILSTLAPELGRMLCAIGRHDEAEPLARRGLELGDEQDIGTQMYWRQTLALVHANRGEHDHAERLAREAVGIGDRTDGLDFQGDALCDLADVLAAAGRADEAAQALGQALARYERKNNKAMVEQVRPRLDALREKMPA